jgi:HD-GYP domain-containing protein (c-di-GMP phosphodiesterase class II)
LVQDVGTTSLAEVLCALSFATDMSMGQLMEHGLKTGYIGLKIADALHLGEDDRQGVFYGALLKDAGCTSCAGIFASFFAGHDLGARRDCLLMKPDSVRDAVAWFWRHAPEDQSLGGRLGTLFSFMTQCRAVMKESVVAHCEVGEMFVRRLGLPKSVQDAVRYAWERWDGNGLAFGLKGSDVPAVARIIHVAQVAEVAHYFGGKAAAIAVATERRGNDFDPDIVAAFLQLTTRSDFWPILEKEQTQATILELRPSAPFDRISEAHCETVCEVLADFADVKSRNTWNHSLGVAQTAVAMARHLGLPQAQATKLKRSAMVQDLGMAAVPVGILDKTTDRTAADWERFRMHPYFTERILTRIEPLVELVPDAISHHEWINGQGYHRGTSGDQIPFGGRILAVADSYVTESRGAGDKADPEQILRQLKGQVGTQLDATCYEALVGSLKGSTPTLRARSHDPRAGGLTEREVEVLRLVGAGLTNRQIAQQLVISDKTVERHLENTFNKLGVSSRTSAVVFAVHQGIVQ